MTPCLSLHRRRARRRGSSDRSSDGRIGRWVRGSRGRGGLASHPGGPHASSQHSENQPPVAARATRRASGPRIPYVGRGHTRGHFSQNMGPLPAFSAMPSATPFTAPPRTATAIPSKLVTLPLPESCRKGFPMNKQNRQVWLQARKTALEVEWNMGIVSYVIKETEVLFELRPRQDSHASSSTSHFGSTPQTWATMNVPQNQAGPSYPSVTPQTETSIKRPAATPLNVNGSHPDHTICPSAASERPFVNAKVSRGS